MLLIHPRRSAFPLCLSLRQTPYLERVQTVIERAPSSFVRPVRYFFLRPVSSSFGRMVQVRSRWCSAFREGFSGCDLGEDWHSTCLQKLSEKPRSRNFVALVESLMEKHGNAPFHSHQKGAPGPGHGRKMKTYGFRLTQPTCSSRHVHTCLRDASVALA